MLYKSNTYQVLTLCNAQRPKHVFAESEHDLISLYRLNESPVQAHQEASNG